MAVIAGPVYVDAPNGAFTPRYGLFSVVPPRDFPQIEAGVGGVQYQVATNAASHGYDVNCTVVGATKTFDAGPATIVGNPFIVYTSMTCGLVGATDDLTHQWIATRAETAEQPIVENLFSTGANGINLGLSGNANTSTLAASTTVLQAISTLEDWLYTQQLYGRRGILHIPAIAGAYLRLNNAIHEFDGVWYTPIGTRISIGAYAGTNPAGTAPVAGHAGFYITPEMAIWRDPNAWFAPYGETVNKAANQYLGLAERNYAISIDGPIAYTDTTLA